MPSRPRILLAVATAAVPLLLGSLLPMSPAAADHTGQPEVVALVGSLQDELGCANDWAPECEATRLLPVDGSPGVYRATFDVPAGAYEYKVALNSSWDENYGAGGAPGGANIVFTAPGGPVTFTYDHATHVISDDVPDALGSTAAAHWLRGDLLAWDLPSPDASQGWTYRLHVAPQGGLTVEDGAVVGGTSVPLTRDAAGLPDDVRAEFPHLAAYDVLRGPAVARRLLEQALTSQLVVAAYDAEGDLVEATGLQLPGVLDELYAGAADEQLGVVWRGRTPSFALWAPTAKDVDLVLRPVGASEDLVVPMRRDREGVWRTTGRPAWYGATYSYDVSVFAPSVQEVVTNRVTDPYSLALTANSQRSVVVHLDDPRLTPEGWADLQKPQVPKPEAHTIYELHVRDFSITDETVPAEHRGTYLAFTHDDTAGMRQLSRLARAGMTDVHLLPVFDIATIPERREDQVEPPCDLASLPPDSEEQQACIDPVRDQDGFNWGYDPFHYTVPEGSYATEPDGAQRTLEFRRMVQGLNRTGLRVVVDVVYNHTTASGQDARSVLDRIVPGYYHRLSATGSVETSTCCANTATEHTMMRKLMVDSVVTWARDYKVDGFRFDLMGHHAKADMLAVRSALDSLTVAEDGVDGSEIYVYGEGWNFGEVANDARFVQATQLNMAGTGIGTFNDRLRDAVRGGGPFDENPRIQGFATGLATDPNADPVNGSPEEQRARLLLYQDQIKVGLTGNLRDYRFVNREGELVTGADVPYNGSPTGYTADPSEAITYVDAHDNETLFDVLQYKLPQSTSMADRVRMNTLALSTTAFSQSPSFWHAGTDILRSKSLDRNSYNSGDWFNRVDWTLRESTWGSGLPPRQDNESKWPFMRPLLADPALEPAPEHIRAAHAQALTLLAIRSSSPLFRLGTAELIQERVAFPTSGPDQPSGVIVMTIDDTTGTGGEDLDPRSEGLVVVWNATTEPTTQSVAAAAGAPYALHPLQAHGVDPVVKEASYDATAGSFTVPPRTVAVFVRR